MSPITASSRPANSAPTWLPISRMRSADLLLAEEDVGLLHQEGCPSTSDSFT